MAEESGLMSTASISPVGRALRAKILEQRESARADAATLDENDPRAQALVISALALVVRRRFAAAADVREVTRYVEEALGRTGLASTGALARAAEQLIRQVLGEWYLLDPAAQTEEHGEAARVVLIDLGRSEYRTPEELDRMLAAAEREAARLTPAAAKPRRGGWLRRREGDR